MVNVSSKQGINMKQSSNEPRTSITHLDDIGGSKYDSSMAATLLEITRRSVEFINEHPAPAASTGPASASIEEVNSCVVNIATQWMRSSPLASVQISHTSQSLIVCGNISGSVFVSDSAACIFVATCGQLRLHQCTNCVVYLHCSSNPIIEGCKGIKFAPLQEYMVRRSLPVILNKFSRILDTLSRGQWLRET